MLNSQREDRSRVLTVTLILKNIILRHITPGLTPQPQIITHDARTARPTCRIEARLAIVLAVGYFVRAERARAGFAFGVVLDLAFYVGLEGGLDGDSEDRHKAKA